ncbi:MAG: Unknown protein [uncultured Sulfurovum sp.]|uniref:DUF86 domain-containing protein n=1 Tax=uncultured Sulfurovum sp. TaxID=269237 RepID=A0A6S6T3I0_9BACT|nr:MAG: Unknown protein [uncultured Sulfurovum sp.]
MVNLKYSHILKKKDIKGSYELRNFIAHDYEGIDFHIVEEVIQTRLPLVRMGVNNALDTPHDR